MALALFNPPAHAEADGPVTIGSKKFTESVILGEIAAHLTRDTGAQVLHRRELGGTRVLWSALLKGDIDIYPEYTGTIDQEIMAGQNVSREADMRRVLGALGIGMSRPLGFNNTYALGMRRDKRAAVGVSRISDLARHPDLVFGFNNEFMDRGDGWRSLQKAYALPQTNVRGLDHDLAYRALVAGDIDLMDLYSTDAEIRHYDLAVLEDDRGHFPTYHALWLFRLDLESRAPAIVKSLRRLEGAIPEEQMIAMNARAKLEKVPETQVAADFLREKFGLTAEVDVTSWIQRLRRRAAEHLILVGISLSAAILVSIPLGLWAAKKPWAAQPILGTVGVIQTIPSLALLVFMIPLLGIGGPPAVVALFLYSLLPIVRNTYTGLKDIPPAARESAAALGLSSGAQLLHVEIPMASRTILAGIKTSAVINVGTATLGAFIGAGGFGQPILTGIRLDDTALILQGAVPAAGLALLAQGAFELADRLFVPKGLRLDSSH